MNKIIELLEQEISKIEEKIETMKVQPEEQEKIRFQTNIKKILESIIDGQIENITKLNLELLSTEFPDLITEEELKKMKFYQDILNVNLLLLLPAQKQKIKTNLQKYKEKIELNLNQLEENIKSRINSSQEVKNLIELKKIEQEISEQEINIDIIEKILDFIKSLDIDQYQKIEIMIEFSQSLYDLPEKENNQENLSNPKEEPPEKEETEQILENEEELDENLLIALFNKYSYDYNELLNEDKEQLRKYGNLDNIDKIFNELKEYKIIIKDNTTNLTNILVLSAPEIVAQIIDNIKIDLGANANKEKIELVLNDYIKHPTIFIRRRKKYTERNNSNKETTKTESVAGAFNNYIINRNLFISKGIDINYAINKCGSIFINSPNTVKNKVSAFEFYGIPPQSYISSLNCLEAPYPLSTIDQFIEVGCYEYVLQNFSRTLFPPDDPMFYRIIMTKRDGKEVYYRKPDPITKKGKYLLKGSIVNTAQDTYGIRKIVIKEDDVEEKENNTDKEVVAQPENNTNKKPKKQKVLNTGPEVVGQYEYYKESLAIQDRYGLYEYTITQSKKKDPCGPLILVTENFYIKKLEENFRVENDEKIYNIGGVIISRYKVLRVYEELIKNALAGDYDSLMFAICRNSILTKEQYKAIEKEITEKMNFRGKSRSPRGVE